MYLLVQFGPKLRTRQALRSDCASFAWLEMPLGHCTGRDPVFIGVLFNLTWCLLSLGISSVMWVPHTVPHRFTSML